MKRNKGKKKSAFGWLGCLLIVGALLAILAIGGALAYMSMIK